MRALYRGKLFSVANTTVLLLMLLAVNPSQNAFASAIYTGDVQLSLLMPGAKTNLFGYGGPTSQFDSGFFTLGNATAAAGLGTASQISAPITPPPPDGQDTRYGRAVDNVNVSGTAGPGDGYSYAESQGALFARLGNLSGSGGGTPPGQVFNAVFDLSYEYNLMTGIDNPFFDDAQAQIGLYARAKPEFGGSWTDYFSIFDFISGTDAVTGAGDIQFTIPLLQNSITLFEAQFFVNGQAISIAQPPLPPIPPIDPPPPLPEPFTIVLFSTGMILMGLIRHRPSRRQRKSLCMV